MGGMKNVHIFRPGRHRAIDGQTLEFSESDLDAMVAAYDPKLHQAPVVIGHPAMDAPAYGWVKSIRRVADGIEAEFSRLNPAFAEGVETGAYQKFSACFYAPGAPNNPVPDVYYLRHVGTLGAQPPAVKGLRSVSFAEDEEGIVEFAESDLAEGQSMQARLWRSLREWLIEQHGVETADKLVPVWTLDALNDAAREAAKDAPANDAAIDAVKEETGAKAEDDAAQAETAAFAEGSPEWKVAQEAAQLRAEVARLRAERQKQTQQAIHAGNVAFAEGLVAKGMKPVHVDAVVAALDVASAGSVAFGEGDAQKPGQSPLADSLKTLFEGLAGSVSFAEQATVKRAADVHTNPLLADALARGKRS